MPCNRGCRDESKTYPKTELYKGVNIRRLWRPRFPQSSNVGRLLNAGWMILRWAFVIFRPSFRPDVVIVGTDPVHGVIVARFWKLFRPKMRVVHWCFDLYPEAAIADGVLPENSAGARILRSCLASAYNACDLIVDIGSCMRRKLDAYHPRSRRATLVPWALDEPSAVVDASPQERAIVFGPARLGLLYSGSFGRAHDHKPILALARRLRSEAIQVAFSVRGNSVDSLRGALTPEDTNVSFAPFAGVEKLGERLASADIHIVSLREEWTGTVVPSKFFGALASGRPVLFCGSPDCAIAEWIRTFSLGWVLSTDNVDEVVIALTNIRDNPREMEEMRERCHRVYQEHFARHVILRRWGQELQALCLPKSAAE